MAVYAEVIFSYVVSLYISCNCIILDMNEKLNYDVGDCSSLSLELDSGSSLLPL